MRKYLALIAVVMMVVTAARLIFPSGSMLTKIEVYESIDSPEISRRVQKVVGQMPGPAKNASPSLGRLLALRSQAGTSNVYEIEMTRPLHVYIIGRTPDPILFTFEAGRFGHSSRYQIVLDQ